MIDNWQRHSKDKREAREKGNGKRRRGREQKTDMANQSGLLRVNWASHALGWCCLGAWCCSAGACVSAARFSCPLCLAWADDSTVSCVLGCASSVCRDTVHRLIRIVSKKTHAVEVGQFLRAANSPPTETVAGIRLEQLLVVMCSTEKEVDWGSAFRILQLAGQPAVNLIFESSANSGREESHQGGAGGGEVGGVEAAEALAIDGVPRAGALRGGQRVAASLLQRLARRLRAHAGTCLSPSACNQSHAPLPSRTCKEHPLAWKIYCAKHQWHAYSADFRSLIIPHYRTASGQSVF